MKNTASHRLIGTCHSCDRDDCPTPRRKSQHPGEGCLQWTSADARRPQQIALWLCPPEHGVKTPEK